jgi:hypothetical protein
MKTSTLATIAALAPLWLASPALAHDQWSNGDRVPDWIKASCCGKADAHHLRPEQVHDYGDWYEVDGYHGNGGKIPHQVALPSQDGDYWIFYAEGGSGRYGGSTGQSGVYCFFGILMSRAPRRRFNRTEDKFIRITSSRGWTYTEAAARLNRNDGSVRMRAIKLGVPFVRRGGWVGVLTKE